MSGISKKLMGTTAAGGGFTAIEEVFSSYLYTGNGSTQTITNGIDLAGEGGLVWAKGRSGATDHQLFDTLRGVTKELISNSTAAEATDADTLTAFNADGFSLGADANVNTSAATYASWTFRKAPRFFDVVTYTGNGSNSGPTVSHNLGIEPAVIILKETSGTSNWFFYTDIIDGTLDYLLLNTTDAAFNGASQLSKNDSTFTINIDSANINQNGATYVAYLYAHDPLGPSGDGSDGLIACGSYTGNGSSNGPEIDLGWEPQWLLIKNASLGTENWVIFDVMRGLVVGTGDKYLRPNLSDAESAATTAISPQPNGFKLAGASGEWNGNGNTMIYIAIRRGPMRAPESGTEVFAMDTYDTTTGDPTGYDTDFPVDAAWQVLNKNATAVHRWSARLTGARYLTPSATQEEVDAATYTFDNQTGFRRDAGTDANDFAWMFRRAPGFFDVVAYTGDGVAGRTVSHNLGVAPEMMIVKGRTNTENWVVYHSASGATQYLRLNTGNAATTSSVFWNNTAPTDTEFTVGAGNTNNASGINYIAYLFASVAGVSKVGSYTGNGTSQTINCGFTAGARFVLIKRISSTGGNWLVWDTARGIVVGNEPYLGLNLTTAETSVDYIDPDPAGFKVINVNTNNSGDTYIFYAIA